MAVPEHARHALVAEDDREVLVRDEDALGGRLDHAPVAGLAGAQGGFGIQAGAMILGRLERAPDDEREAREVVLGDVVGRAELEHLDRGLLADGAGDGDDRGAGAGGEQLAQRRPTVPSRQRVVEEGDVPLVYVEGRGELVLARDTRRLDAVPGTREAELLELGVLLAVVDAEEAQRRSGRHAAAGAVPHCGCPTGAGSLSRAQNAPTCRTASTNSLKSTGFTT
jgi:hypothetical protein